MRRYNSLRLSGYDYSGEGAYFITIVSHGREAIFGRVVNGEMLLNAFGRIVENTWKDLINHNKGIVLEEFVVMPNHFHGIIIIVAIVGAGSRVVPILTDRRIITSRKRIPEPEGKPARREEECELDRESHEPNWKGHGPSPTGGGRSLSELVRQLKTFSAKPINNIRHTPGQPLWQRNYYDHIIRDEKDYYQISEYIVCNPGNWVHDDVFIESIALV